MSEAVDRTANTTTNINELGAGAPPTDVPAMTTGGGSGGNGGETGVTLDQSTISQIVSGLQQAGTTGATKLPSRDIPRDTTSITHDASIQPHYIAPEEQHSDYIQEQYQENDIVNSYYNKQRHEKEFSDLYSELQYPILVAVLFFLFQMPIVRQVVFKYVPALFNMDGNYNINGILATSILFGGAYFAATKSIYMFSRF